MRSSAALLASLSSSLLASFSSAHFILDYPPSIGFIDDNEGIAPCGGFTPDFSNASSIVDFHVGGEALAITLTHTQANWLFRATLDTTAQSNWTQIFPIVQQSGLGAFCEPQVTVPESFVGQHGIVGVVCDGPDGILYQCIAANFVSGSASPPSQCKNATITASFVSDPQLSAMVGSGGGNSTTGNSTSPSSPSTTNSASASPTKKSGAASLQQPAVISLGSAVALLSMALVGGALMA